MTETPKKRPCVMAWDKFLEEHPTFMAGTTSGEYLKNRLRAAFESGWYEAERRVVAALNGDPR